MRNRGFIVFLTVIVTLLCVYYLSFTFVSRSVNQDAITYAKDAEGNVDFSKKQAYLDSIWNEPVYNLFGAEYTLKEVKETELSLGLDLQGGMHVTLEVSPVDIILGLSGNSQDPALLEALDKAREMQKTSNESFANLFYQAFQETSPDQKLAPIFTNASNRDKISFEDTDQEVLNVIKEEITQAIDRSFEILRTRVDRFGTSQPNIQRLQGTGRIQIELPGVENQERVRKLLQGVAKLEFWEVSEYTENFESLQAINNKLVQEEQLKSTDVDELGEEANQDALADLAVTEEAVEEVDTISSEDSLEALLTDTTAADTAATPEISQFFTMINFPQGLVDLKDTLQVNRILDRMENGDLKGLFPGTLKFLWGVKPMEIEGEDPMMPLYIVRVGRGGKAPLTGEVITDARQSFDEGGGPSVSMSMNAVGAKKWRNLTRENVGRRIAIVLDNYVYSAPNVQNEIPGGQSVITGNFTMEEAEDLANVLKAGALPARTRIVEEAVIGPTLGKEAQKQGIFSMVAGLVIVILFMFAYYSKGGLVANVALVFNVFFILGILAQLNAALTLPGIAGIVLTIGMSIDANVLIFERIREELRGGSALLRAISQGYDKAFSSILDANVTTFITGAILFVLGSGPVKGFATTLMIGIVCSFFTAVFITRVIVTWMTKKGDESKISFETGLSKKVLSSLSIDFMSRRRIAYIGSAIFIVVGLSLVVVQGGLNYGVDFTGGRSYIVEFQNPVVPSELEPSLGQTFEGLGTEVKTYGANNILKITTGYLINDESSEADQEVKSKLIGGIEAHTGLNYTEDDRNINETNFSIVGSSKVGATIADDIKRTSQESIIVALIAIFLYILIRFRKWQFGVGAVAALFHDVMVVISAFAFARLFGKAFEIDQVFIASLLTIVGYSINDTVVVFDRIRENLILKPHTQNKETFNISLNETLNRTLITSLTTLIVILVLLIFGGEVLRGFSFALLVGILVGTYSSVFIASPISLDFFNKSLKSKGDS